MPEQLGLQLPSVPALGRADFLVAPSNAVAVAMIESSAEKLVLTGPDGAGKTHLAHVWAAQHKARIIAARDLRSADVPGLAEGAVAVEDVPTIASEPQAQNALFHLHNMVLAEGHPLLLTGRGPVRDWGITLPDLASRIAAAPAATLELPDDTLLAAVLAKLFSDRQLMPKADLIPYLILRMDRSFAAARDLVESLDAASLAQKRPISRTLAGPLLDKGQGSAR
ncbi:chromosomal replication initiator DnaA [uncultured Roseobacter sp.]|uniref:chromosomal replication initiator DnaA n=1 Tax=uncultured Roseobacter sp. TaxID=114847 RepID=UPI002607738C|nr:chromosomal replication initiator DnaA [uncultured Roseobacter sp.]